LDGNGEAATLSAILPVREAATRPTIYDVPQRQLRADDRLFPPARLGYNRWERARRKGAVPTNPPEAGE